MQLLTIKVYVMKKTRFFTGMVIEAIDFRFSTVLFLMCIFSITGCKKMDPVVPSDSMSQSESDEHKLSRDLDLQLVAGNFASPVTLVDAPDGTNRLFVVDQTGKVWIIDENWNTLPQPFIDVSGKLVELESAYDERGLLGLAFHPDYKSNGKFYLF